VAHFFFLAQTFFEMVDFLGEEVVHFQFFLHYVLEFFDVGIHIEVHIAHALYFGDEFAFLGQKLGVFFDGCHMGGEDFFLFLEDVGDLLLEGEVLLAYVVVFEGGFHDVDVFF
jgi:hypothetical protein